MGPVRQNPIQRTVRTAHLSVLMIVHNFQHTIQHRTVLISPFLPPDNHHSSDVVYRRTKGGTLLARTCESSKTGARKGQYNKAADSQSHSKVYQTLNITNK